MSTTLARIAGFGLLLLITLISGLWLSRTGRPFNVRISTIHKLVAVTAFAILVATTSNMNQDAGLGGLQLAIVALAALSFIGSIATGGILMAVNRPASMIVRQLHRYLPILTVLSSAGSLYLLAASPS
jgi:hypothetical protein